MEKKRLKEPNLGYLFGNILTELCGPIKVLHEMWEQAENIQGET